MNLLLLFRYSAHCLEIRLKIRIAMYDLTIIIPTWNQSELLRNCLQSILQQTEPCKVIVVDNGSTDSTETMLRIEWNAFQGRLQYLKLKENNGFSKAINEGIRMASTDCIALLNNDTEVEARWVESGLNALTEFTEYSFFASSSGTQLTPSKTMANACR